MKQGDLIGIGGINKNKVDLFCEVINVNNDFIEAWVINGGWKAKLFRDGGLQVWNNHVLINTIYNQCVRFTGVIPAKKRRDFNAAIEYIDAQLAKQQLTTDEVWHLDLDIKKKADVNFLDDNLPF